MTYSNKDTKIVKFNKCDLNSMKDMAHKYFDQIWEFKYCERNEAYQHLANYLGIPEPKAHMRFMDYKTCKKVVEWSVMMLNDMRRLDLDFGVEKLKHPYYELVK